MSGTFTAYFLAIYLDGTGFWNQHPIISILLILAVAVVVSMTIAIVLERIAYRPLRGAPRLVPLITAIGASFFLQYTFRGLYGSGVKTYPDLGQYDEALDYLARCKEKLAQEKKKKK